MPYAVFHIESAPGGSSDGGLNPHIDRQEEDGREHIPRNAIPGNNYRGMRCRELIAGNGGRRAAIAQRLEEYDRAQQEEGSGMRKRGKNSVNVMRFVISGSHDQMMRLKKEERLEEWENAVLKWLRAKFGERNIVSAVAHYDEKTPHLHVTFVPITDRPEPRANRRKKQKAEPKMRLCKHAYFSPGKQMIDLQTEFAEVVRPFGFERGVINSEARHEKQDEAAAREVREKTKLKDIIQTTIDAQTAEIEQLNNEKHKLKTDVAELKKERIDAIQDAEQARQDARQARAEADVQVQRRDDAAADADAISSRRAAALADANAAEDLRKRKRKEANLQTANKILHFFGGKIDDYRDREIAALKEELQSLRQERRALRKDAEADKGKIDELTADIKLLNRHIKELEADKAEEPGRIRAAVERETSDLRTELDGTKAVLKDVKSNDYYLQYLLLRALVEACARMNIIEALLHLMLYEFAYLSSDAKLTYKSWPKQRNCNGTYRTYDYGIDFFVNGIPLVTWRRDNEPRQESRAQSIDNDEPRRTLRR